MGRARAPRLSAVYEPPQEERPGCRDVWLLTRATWLALVPFAAVVIALIAVVGAAIVLFAVHPALALIPVLVVVVAVLVYRRWEQRRFQ